MVRGPKSARVDIIHNKKQWRNLTKTNKPEAAGSSPSLSLEEEEKQLPAANTDGALDLASCPTVQEITANKTKVTDEKLGP